MAISRISAKKVSSRELRGDNAIVDLSLHYDAILLVDDIFSNPIDSAKRRLVLFQHA